MRKEKIGKGFAALLFCLLVFNGSFAAAEIGVNPVLPPEQDVFGVEPLDPPDPESRDYVIVSDVKNAAESFNNEERETRNIAISGKTVVFQVGHSNGLYEDYNERDYIKNMEIYAEKLIIRNPLNLPQTNVVIYASEIRFEDPDDGTYARINTTPRDKRDVDPGNNADGSGINGINGLNAGNISLFIENIYTDDTLIPIYCFNPFTWEQDICGHESPKRFIMTGGYGQKAGPGTRGVNGNSLTTWYNAGWSQAQTDRWKYHTVYIETWKEICDWWFFGSCTDWDWKFNGSNGSKTWPSDGTDAKPAGKPGNPGNGGNLTISANLTAEQLIAYVSN
ncbi:MAG: hypothetical protein V2I97_20770, partial [Desulfococcaceae bacterium]|nr:hypothetical protein [Desulfococcaceae bacterium]